MSIGQRLELIQNALIDAFPTKSSLEQFLCFKLDKDLNRIAGGNNLEEIVFLLIKTAKAEGWLNELIIAARNDKPRNPLLRNIATELLRDLPTTSTKARSESAPFVSLEQGLCDKLVMLSLGLVGFVVWRLVRVCLSR
jgi:hypothetical protein